MAEIVWNIFAGIGIWTVSGLSVGAILALIATRLKKNVVKP